MAVATISQLVSALAKSLGVPERTLAVCARYVREEGLIAQKGRGPSAAQMAPRDAANLLLAIMAANELHDAPACARRARELACVGFERNLDGKVINVEDAPYRGFVQGATLGVVLERMIDYSARHGDLCGDRDEIITNLDLEIDRPGLHADLTFDDGSDQWVAKFSYSFRTEAAARRLVGPYRALNVSARADLIQAVADIAVALLGREPQEGEVVVPPWAAESERLEVENRELRKSRRGKRPKR